ncbi:hypothetical protein [Streptomyces sp. NPDC002467]
MTGHPTTITIRSVTLRAGRTAETLDRPAVLERRATLTVAA